MGLGNESSNVFNVYSFKKAQINKQKKEEKKKEIKETRAKEKVEKAKEEAQKAQEQEEQRAKQENERPREDNPNKDPDDPRNKEKPNEDPNNIPKDETPNEYKENPNEEQKYNEDKKNPEDPYIRNDPQQNPNQPYQRKYPQQQQQQVKNSNSFLPYTFNEYTSQPSTSNTKSTPMKADMGTQWEKPSDKWTHPAAFYQSQVTNVQPLRKNPNAKKEDKSMMTDQIQDPKIASQTVLQNGPIQQIGQNGPVQQNSSQKKNMKDQETITTSTSTSTEPMEPTPQPPQQQYIPPNPYAMPPPNAGYMHPNPFMMPPPPGYGMQPNPYMMPQVQLQQPSVIYEPTPYNFPPPKNTVRRLKDQSMQTDIKPTSDNSKNNDDDINDNPEQGFEQPRKKSFQPKQSYRVALEDDDDVDIPSDLALGDVKDVAEKKKKKATKPVAPKKIPPPPEPEPIPDETEAEETRPEPEVEPTSEAPPGEEPWPQTPDSDKTNDAPIVRKPKQNPKKSQKTKPTKVTTSKPPWQGWKKKPDYLSNQNHLLDV